ncbi:glycosyl hydrolase, family 88 [Ostertagia ostertagi]
MAQPFYAEWAATFKNDPKSFDDIANQFIYIEEHTRDKTTGLMRHAWDESKEMAWADKTTGLAPNVWARAMGWYGAALVDVLEYFPAEHPKRKDLVAILDRYAATVARAQDKKNGLWWDVMNEPYPGKKGNYFEASAACQFVYTLAKGVRLGALNETYLSTAKSGYKGILQQFVAKEKDGLTHLNGTVSVSGLGGKPFRDGSFEYYISEKVIQDDAKGVGAFIQASNEMEILADLAAGKGAILPLRDSLDQRIVNDVRNRSGAIIDVQGGYPHGTPYAQTVSAWPVLNSLVAPVDTDHDGMPDYWENNRGLNPNDPADRNNYSSTGYTNLEDYLNGLTGNVSVPTTGGQAAASISIYPNPARDQVTLLLPEAITEGTATIYDVNGKQLLVNKVAKGVKQSLFDVNALPTGTYFIVYRNGQSVAASFFKQ